MDRMIMAALDLDYTVCDAPQDQETEEWRLISSLMHDVGSDSLLGLFAFHDRFAKRFGGQYDGHEYQAGPVAEEGLG
ncbi:MAG: hypothetical protein KBH07_00275 [Flavobacteriales bacterium]|nr:hypothetical protein [Flavobacteriales bacterium]MBP9080851.1 hypothetical protein [Flavobacteriales bacterium]